MREVGSGVDWSAVIEKRFSEDEQFVSATLGALNRYYNRVGVLLERRVLVRSLVLGEMRADVALFDAPLAAWLAFTEKRRRSDLATANIPDHALKTYWRGTRRMLREWRKA